MKIIIQSVFTYFCAFSLMTSCATDDAELPEMAEMEEEIEEIEEAAASFSIGDTGPAGGVVFYDKGEVTDGWQYMEVGPEDIGTGSQFGCLFSEILDARSLEIGDGLTNTEAIVAYHDALETYYTNPEQCDPSNDGTVAAKFVMDYELNGLSDWHLPSENEALELYTALQLTGVVNFTENKLYWTSTEHLEDSATAINFYPEGDQAWGWAGKSFDDTQTIRPVRYF